MLSRARGVTLLELLIVVTIVAILASIAYPSYRDQMRKTRRGDTQGALVGFASAMERYFTENSTYLGAAAGGGDTGTPRIFAGEAPLDGTTKYYDLTIQAATANTYTLAAAPKGAQAGDPCGTLTLTHQGVRAPATAGGISCWH